MGTAASVIAVIKWIGGREITKIETNNGIVTLYIGDKFIQTEEKILKLLRNDKVRRAMEDAIKNLLKKGDKIYETVTKEESNFFTAPEAESKDLDVTTYETTLQLISPSFQDNNKWRFSDGGSNSFYADMRDESFNARIDSHSILFGKGDIIRAVVKDSRPLDAKGVLHVDRSVTSVLEHRNATVQLNLLADGQS